MGELTSQHDVAAALPRGTVTLLFTDVEGSTRLLRRLGRERYGALLAAQRDLLTDAIARWGGVVVDSHGDSVFAAFGSAGSAVAAAVAAQRALGEEEWAGEEVRVRMGVHTGEATPAGHAYVGLAVHRAKRVADAAHGGQVLVSAATAGLVGDELPEAVELRDVARASLAGFEGVERLFQLVAPGLRDEFPPVRARAAAGRPQLLEREPELATLAAAVAAAAEGAGRVVAIEGAAGIGKTSLLAEARARATGAAYRVLSARGAELERTFPYGVVRQLFEPALARLAQDERASVLADAAGLAAPLFGAGPAEEPAGDDRGFAVLHGLYWLTANLAERGPLLLAVDDLHWTDAASLRWLAYLANRIEGLPVLVVATLRPPRRDADPALAALLADPKTIAVRPAALTAAAAAAIVEELVARETVEDVEQVATLCHEAAGGNPLLLRELVTALTASPLPHDRAELAATVGRIAPEIVSRRVRLELAKLGNEATALAGAVAVLGDDVQLAPAAELARLDASTASQAAALLAEADVLASERQLAFVHPLVRSAVYDAIPPMERDAGHDRAAALLSQRGAPIERVAAQLVVAPPSGRGDVVATLREAASRSLADGAAESAAAYLRRALEEPPPADERADVLLELAAAEAFLGAPQTVERLREAVRLLSDPARRAVARLELARALFWVANEEDAIAEIERGIGEADDPHIRRSLEAEYFTAALRLPALHEQAHARLRRLEVPDADDWGARMLLSLKAYALTFEGEQREQAIALAERGISRGMTWETVTWAFWGGVYTLLWADRFEPALAFIDRVLTDARRRGAPFSFSGTSMVRAVVGFHRGRLSDAEADARAALAALPHRRVMFMPHCFGWLAQILVERGQRDEAAAVLAEAGADGELPETFLMVPLLRARALLRLAQGQAAVSAADALACGRIFESVGARNPALSHWRSEAARALLAAGDADEARRLAAEELELARRWGAPRAIGRALRVLGLAEGGESGLALLRESVLTLEDSPALLERARSLVELGSALRRAGKKIEARDRLRPGLDLADRCGATPLAEHAREELVAAGAKPRSKALSGVESLTPSERRIAAMAGEGLTNREIAQALFVTPRTVEMHLSNAFRKLGIGSRTQLTTALAGTA